MVTKDEIQASPVFTNEMKATLQEIRELIEYARSGGGDVKRITLNKKLWEPIRKDKKRSGWKNPRACGLIHYESTEPSFDGVTLGAPNAKELQEYVQEEAFKES